MHPEFLQMSDSRSQSGPRPAGAGGVRRTGRSRRRPHRTRTPSSCGSAPSTTTRRSSAWRMLDGQARSGRPVRGRRGRRARGRGHVAGLGRGARGSVRADRAPDPAARLRAAQLAPGGPRVPRPSAVEHRQGLEPRVRITTREAPSQPSGRRMRRRASPRRGARMHLRWPRPGRTRPCSAGSTSAEAKAPDGRARRALRRRWATRRVELHPERQRRLPAPATATARGLRGARGRRSTSGSGSTPG